MEVKIGIKESPRELSFESDESTSELRERLEKAIANGELIALKDAKGRELLVDAGSIAFVELGGDASRKVGFVS